MKKRATLLRGAAQSSQPASKALALPPDLLQKVRSRVQLVALLLIVGFIVDPVLLVALELFSRITGKAAPDVAAVPIAANVVGILISMAAWRTARSPRVSQSRLLQIGLVYEVVICLVISLDTHHHFLSETGQLPHLTWVAALIILFPLIIPIPPRRMLLASVAAALTSPLSLLLLQWGDGGAFDAKQYVYASVNPLLAVVLAFFAARVVYGLNVEVVRAREMGSYRLVEMLGRGGMGEVWRAEHRMLARPAAIKLIPPEMFASTAGVPPEVVLQRFEKEAQATASLRSPHTIDLYDYGQAEDGSLYYVMELLDGVDLERLVEQSGPLPAERVVHLLRQACGSLAEAHAASLIHRDIKPANIFVCRYGLETDFVKVLDFGLVKSRDDADANDPRITAENAVGGTPAFMAPEQVMASAEIDGRADLYSLGCVAYWLLTGRMVFEASTALEAINHHLNTEPTAPSEHTAVAVPPELDALVLRCLAKSPGDRPRDANELANDLEAIAAAHPWSAVQSREWWEANRPHGARKQSLAIQVDRGQTGLVNDDCS